MTWKARYDRMKKTMGYTDADIARMIDHSQKSVNVSIRRVPFPRTMRLAILVFERLTNLSDD